MTKIEALTEKFNNLSVADQVYIHNEYCEAVNDYDRRVEYMDCFDEIWGDSEPYWIACRVFYGDFNPNHEFYYLNGYGNFVSFDYADDKNSPINVDEIVDWMIEGNFSEFEDYIGSDYLLDEFVAEKLPDEDTIFVFEKIEKICEEETFDVLADDWDDLAKAYFSFDYTNEGE